MRGAQRQHISCGAPLPHRVELQERQARGRGASGVWGAAAVAGVQPPLHGRHHRRHRVALAARVDTAAAVTAFAGTVFHCLAVGDAAVAIVQAGRVERQADSQADASDLKLRLLHGHAVVARVELRQHLMAGRAGGGDSVEHWKPRQGGLQIRREHSLHTRTHAKVHTTMNS